MPIRANAARRPVRAARREGIEPSTASRDVELVRRAAHTLKTNGLTFGALSFAAACTELERTAKLGDLDAATSLAGEVERTWDNARPAIEALGA